MITRAKSRYVLVESSGSVNVTDASFSNALLDSIRGEIGSLEYAKAGIRIVSGLGDRFFVIKVNRGYENGVMIALSFVKNMQGRKIGFYTLKTSGAIKKLVLFFNGLGVS